MKRKVNLVGQNTLTVSLPTKWAQEHGIKKGIEVELLEDNDRLVIEASRIAKKIKKVVIDIDHFDKLMLSRYLDEFYRVGAEEIVLKFTKDTLPDYKNNKEVLISKILTDVVQRYIGMEIISQRNNVVVLQTLITKEDCDKIEVVRQRLYFLIKEFLDEFSKSMDSDFKSFNDKAYAYHDNIAKFTYYYFRILNFSNLTEPQKTRYFGLYNIIDLAIDKLRHTSERYAEMKKKSPKLINYVREIFAHFLEQFEIINKQSFKMEDLDAIISKRYKLVQKVNKEKFNEDEFKVIAECKILLDMINPFCEAYVAANIEKYFEEY